MDPMNPSAILLCNLGSLIVHYEEYIETGQPEDLMAANALREDPDVIEWRKEMGKLALLPVKRSDR